MPTRYVVYLYSRKLRLSLSLSILGIRIVEKPLTVQIAQVINYQAHQQLHEHLAAEYTHQRTFDAILDTVGSQDLYTHSPQYLKPNGIYVNVGSTLDKSALHTFWRWFKNSNWPAFLGGTPRRFIMFGAAISPEGVKSLAELAKEGKLRIQVDKVFEMDKALEVRVRKRAGAASRLTLSNRHTSTT